MEPFDPITSARGVGPVLGRRLAEAGCRRIADLLAHLPVRYEDRRALGRLPGRGDDSSEGPEEPLTVVVRLEKLRRVFGRRRFSRVEAVAHDGENRIGVVWFNRPYLVNQLDEDASYLLHGVPRRRGGDGDWQLANPTVERVDEEPAGGGVRPVYGRIGDVPPSRVERLVHGAVSRLTESRGSDWIDEWLPIEERARHGLPSLAEALTAVHCPSTEASVEALNERRSPAHARLAYGEFLLQQLQLAAGRRRRSRHGKPHRYESFDAAERVARELLPFRLTRAQERVLEEIETDLLGRRPMLRLVQGDVGCGKTVLAALACLVAARSGLQSALMAPTELLAEQHFASLRRLLGSHLALALVTSSQRVASDGCGAVLERVADGRIDLTIGTHALIQERTRFACLGLAVVDEQHRFGVVQRQALAQKGQRPDLLVMTATPIPRSLALTVYGDLDVSLVDEMPPGRSPVETRVLTEKHRDEAVDLVRQRLRRGGRAYVVFPLIDSGEGSAAGLPSLEKSGAWWAEALAGTHGVVHGRLGREERDETMSRFSTGSIRVLLATTVIEVGVDVPEATAMVILGAERFGLAQLHQLRGRIGRGTDQTLGEPICIAISGGSSAEAERRLAVFEASTDGFRIAEEDLRQRGPGEVLGTRQAGLPQFRFGDLARDWKWLVAARADAGRLLDRLAEPGKEPLRRQLERRIPALGASAEGTAEP
ncbi:MAG: ATP-dependent DNA helicase RecG [Acidobacteria bacterium]|nr:ATP-dependent DNA helicase RecG [Acidobacteriota bacterium]